MGEFLGDLSVADLSVSGVVLLLLLAAGMALVRGDLVSGKQVDRMMADRDNRITEQAAALREAPKLAIAQQAAITSLTESVRDFAEAQRLNVRVAQAMHDNLTGDEK